MTIRRRSRKKTSIACPVMANQTVILLSDDDELSNNNHDVITIEDSIIEELNTSGALPEGFVAVLDKEPPKVLGAEPVSPDSLGQSSPPIKPALDYDQVSPGSLAQCSPSSRVLDCEPLSPDSPAQNSEVSKGLDPVSSGSSDLLSPDSPAQNPSITKGLEPVSSGSSDGVSPVSPAVSSSRSHSLDPVSSDPVSSDSPDHSRLPPKNVRATKRPSDSPSSQPAKRQSTLKLENSMVDFLETTQRGLSRSERRKNKKLKQKLKQAEAKLKKLNNSNRTGVASLTITVPNRRPPLLPTPAYTAIATPAPVPPPVVHDTTSQDSDIVILPSQDDVLVISDDSTVEVSDDENQLYGRSKLFRQNQKGGKKKNRNKAGLKVLMKSQRKARDRERNKYNLKLNKMASSEQSPKNAEPSPTCSKSPDDSKVRERRPIVVDGCNVAFGHGQQRRFSAKGIALVVNHFKSLGHTKIKVFIPSFREHHFATQNPEILNELDKEGHIVYTPSRRVNNKRIICYDDRYIVEYAHLTGGVIVTRDNFRDVVAQNPEWRKTVENRILMYTFVDDVLFFPNDPLGKDGPDLHHFLTFPPGESSTINQQTSTSYTSHFLPSTDEPAGPSSSKVESTVVDGDPPPSSPPFISSSGIEVEQEDDHPTT